MANKKMKKLTLLFIAVAILLCASCKQEPVQREIENKIEAIDLAAMERTINNGNTKLRLILERKVRSTPGKGGARLKIWKKTSEQEDFDRDPDVVYTGTYIVDSYITTDSESKTSIVRTKQECGIVNFTSCEVKEGTSETEKTNYINQKSLYSGVFDFEYVSDYKTEKNDTGGTTKSYGHRVSGHTEVNLTVTMHPDYTKTTLLIANGWKNAQLGADVSGFD